MEEYTSEFQAPIYSTLDVRTVGMQVVRTVVMNGEAIEFTIDRQVYNEGRALEDE